MIYLMRPCVGIQCPLVELSLNCNLAKIFLGKYLSFLSFYFISGTTKNDLLCELAKQLTLFSSASGIG